MSIERVGVAGAGTMGAGIAQLACLGGYDTVLQDPFPEALEPGENRVRAGLEKGASSGRWTAEEASAAAGRIATTTSLEELARCDLVIEAAPERLELKRELFAALSSAGSDELILATNTSSLPVGAMATASEHPERVVGMHFFNPPALMPLVEIVPALDTLEEVVTAATGVGERMGRTPIRASDVPGFVANRCARPFGLEALRLLGEGVAEVEQIDRICRLGAGFRMGPFELMDLVGIDVGFEVARSFYEQSFHEPRWQPHPLQAQMAQSGRHGRKSGRGWYDYTEDPYRPRDPEPDPGEFGPPAVPHFRLPGSSLVELLGDRPGTAEAEASLREAGFHVERVGAAPGGVLGRIVCQIVNEAAFALEARTASVADINTAMRLGFNWPKGPLEWADELGAGAVVEVLDQLWESRRQERYRVCPLLREMASGA